MTRYPVPKNRVCYSCGDIENRNATPRELRLKITKKWIKLYINNVWTGQYTCSCCYSRDYVRRKRKESREMELKRKLGIINNIKLKLLHKFVILIIISSIIHELGHIIIGGGFHGFEYAPYIDLLSTKVYVSNWNIYSAFAGFLFTTPLLALRIYPYSLFAIFLIQSRYDFMYIIHSV